MGQRELSEKVYYLKINKAWPKETLYYIYTKGRQPNSQAYLCFCLPRVFLCPDFSSLSRVSLRLRHCRLLLLFCGLWLFHYFNSYYQFSVFFWKRQCSSFCLKIIIFLELFRKLTIFESLGLGLDYWAGFIILRIFVKKNKISGFIFKNIIFPFIYFLFFHLGMWI